MFLFIWGIFYYRQLDPGTWRPSHRQVTPGRTHKLALNLSTAGVPPQKQCPKNLVSTRGERLSFPRCWLQSLLKQRPLLPHTDCSTWWHLFAIEGGTQAVLALQCGPVCKELWSHTAVTTLCCQHHRHLCWPSMQMAPHCWECLTGEGHRKKIWNKQQTQKLHFSSSQTPYLLVESSTAVMLNTDDHDI